MGKIQTNRLVVFDLETTGTNPLRDSVIQVGAVALDGELSPCGEFEVKIRFDEGRASSAALEVNSFERSTWNKDAVSSGEAARRFSAFLHEHATLLRTGAHGKPYRVSQLASYNSGYDGPFLSCWFELAREFLPADRRVLCLMQRTHWALVESHACAFPENLKLGTVCRELGIPLGDNAHDALHDARAAASLYRVLHGLSPLPWTGSHVISPNQAPRRSPGFRSQSRTRRAKRPSQARYGRASHRRRRTRGAFD